MDEFRLMIGKIAGRLGILICVLAVVAHLIGLYDVFAFPTTALFEAGIACLLIGCFELLLVRTKSH